jgi:hypothetical protein
VSGCRSLLRVVRRSNHLPDFLWIISANVKVAEHDTKSVAVWGIQGFPSHLTGIFGV